MADVKLSSSDYVVAGEGHVNQVGQPQTTDQDTDKTKAKAEPGGTNLASTKTPLPPTSGDCVEQSVSDQVYGRESTSI